MASSTDERQIQRRQKGKNNNAGLVQNGKGNLGVIHQNGKGHNATFDQKGKNNAYGIFQYGRPTPPSPRPARATPACCSSGGIESGLAKLHLPGSSSDRLKSSGNLTRR